MHELCTLMKDEKLKYCARAFEEENVDGKELYELSKEDFIWMLKETGGKADGHRPNLLSVASVCSCITDVFLSTFVCVSHTQTCPRTKRERNGACYRHTSEKREMLRQELTPLLSWR